MVEKRTASREGWKLYQVVDEEDRRSFYVIRSTEDPEGYLDYEEIIETDCWLSDILGNENITIIQPRIK